MCVILADGIAIDDLLWVNLPIITNTVCAQTFGSDIISSTICTSGAGMKSVCGVRFVLFNRRKGANHGQLGFSS